MTSLAEKLNRHRYFPSGMLHIPEIPVERIYFEGRSERDEIMSRACVTNPFSLDKDGNFTGKLLYSRPEQCWSDIIGCRGTYHPNSPNKFVFIEMIHRTAKMHLHVLEKRLLRAARQKTACHILGKYFHFATT